jgi:hypothetical protein
VEAEDVEAEEESTRGAVEVAEEDKAEAEVGEEGAEALHPLAVQVAGFHMTSGNQCQRENANQCGMKGAIMPNGKLALLLPLTYLI